MEKRNLGAFLAVLRRNKGWTQKELAEILHVSDKTVSRWERDESLPDLFLIPEIARLYGITSDELLRGEILADTLKKSEHSKGCGQQEALESDAQTEVEYRNRVWSQFLCVGMVAAGLALTACILLLFAEAKMWNGGIHTGYNYALELVSLLLCGFAGIVATVGIGYFFPMISAKKYPDISWQRLRRKMVYTMEMIYGGIACIVGAKLGEVELQDSMLGADIAGIVTAAFAVIIISLAVNYYLHKEGMIAGFEE